MIEIISLIPHVVEKIWGGGKLSRLKSSGDLSFYEGNREKIGETWEVSLLEEGPCLTSHGEKLKDIIPKDFNYLVKFIDTQDVLSIQVHPDNEYARKRENSLGKTECWLILEAEKGAGVYLGLRQGCTKDQLREALHGGRDLSAFLNFFEVSPGDFFIVPAGTLHALGKGVTLAEIQQSSGVTYRVWDWNRLDSKGRSRTLHVEKAFDVINFEEEFNRPENFRTSKKREGKGRCSLMTHDDFCVDSYILSDQNSLTLSLPLQRRPSTILSLTEGLKIKGREFPPFKAILIWGKGEKEEEREEEIEIAKLGESLSKEVTFLHIY